MLYLRFLCIYHHYDMSNLLLHREPVYRRAQSQEYVVLPIPIHIPPLLQGLLTDTLGTSISQSTITGVCCTSDPYTDTTIITWATYCYTENQYYYNGYLLIHWELEYPRAQSQEYVVPPIPIHIPPLLHELLTVIKRTSISQSTITGVSCTSDPYTYTTIITWVTYCYTENQYIVEHNHRSKLYLLSLYIYHHYYMGYLLLHWKPVYRRAQSQEQVVPPIPIHIPPLLHGLLTVTLRTSISQSTITGVSCTSDPYTYTTIITGVTY